MRLLILGTGCAKCERLEANAREALGRLGLDAELAHERDPAEIAAWGVLRTPALALDDELVVSGRVASADEIAAVIAGRAPQ